MQRLFGTDILHTWVLGFVEACVGFSLSVIDVLFVCQISASPKVRHNQVVIM